MKLSAYAKKIGVSYKTAWNWYKAGKLAGYQAETGTIIVTESDTPQTSQRVAIYARVSSAKNKNNLDAQAERLVSYCAAKGYQVAQIVKEIGSGVNDTRPKLMKLLQDTSIGVIVVEHKDRATRFGANYIATLLETQGRRLEIVNLADNGKEDLIQDLVAIMYSFLTRMYGQRRAKRTTEHIIKTLNDPHDQEA